MACRLQARRRASGLKDVELKPYGTCITTDRKTKEVGRRHLLMCLLYGTPSRGPRPERRGEALLTSEVNPQSKNHRGNSVRGSGNSTEKKPQRGWIGEYRREMAESTPGLG